MATRLPKGMTMTSLDGAAGFGAGRNPDRENACCHKGWMQFPFETGLSTDVDHVRGGDIGNVPVSNGIQGTLLEGIRNGKLHHTNCRQVHVVVFVALL